MPRSVTADKPEQDTPKTNALVAAAITISSSIERRKWRKAEAWQEEAWALYDTVGELRYATTWFSNALSRAKLHAATVAADGTVTPVTKGVSKQAMDELLGGTKGNRLLKAMGQHFFVAGEWYLVGREAREDDESITSAAELWEVVSVQEMKTSGTGQRTKWWIDYGDGVKVELTDKDVIIRMWNPHPRHHAIPDSPVRSALPALRELQTLSGHINAQVYSRLTGAGILLVPSEMTFTKPPNESLDVPPNADPFLFSLGATMMQAVADPSDVSALVPTMLKAPGETLQYVRHITFWSDLDEKALEMRDNALRRVALALDMPPEVLLGTADVNHWGSWQIEESSIKAHIEPALEVICGSLSTSYLQKAGKPNDVVAYDTTALRLRPNRSKEALELYDRGAINEQALRRETGFEEDDAHNPETYKKWLLRKVASGSATPEQVGAALKQLGVDLGDVEGQRPREERPDPSLKDHPVREEPERQAAALLAVCDAMVVRAIERAGNRLKNKTGNNTTSIDPLSLHCSVDISAAEATRLLDGAWTLLPRLVTRHGFAADDVEHALDGYCRSLLTTSSEHDVDKMIRYLRIAGLEVAA